MEIRNHIDEVGLSKHLGPKERIIHFDNRVCEAFGVPNHMTRPFLLFLGRQSQHSLFQEANGGMSVRIAEEILSSVSQRSPRVNFILISHHSTCAMQDISILILVICSHRQRLHRLAAVLAQATP